MSLLLRGVTKVFEAKGRPPHTAVDDVSLEIEGGRFVTLLGPSGCGKTTLLRLVAGFEQPTRGEIVHDGRSLDDVPPYRRGFPMVFQSYALFPHMTVAENVAYGLRVRGTPKAEAGAMVERAIALLGLESQAGKHPAKLSGGQQQRVALARALVVEPRLILLDEPLSNLDAGLRVAMRGEIRALQRRLGITALYVTHDQEEALAVSDTVVVMNEGRIEQAGTPAELFQRPATAFVARFMGAPNILPVMRQEPDALALLGERYPAPADGSAAHAAEAVLRSDAIAYSPAGRHGATVEDVVFLGARTELVLRCAEGTRLVVEQASGGATPMPAAGDRVRFDLRPERLVYLRGRD
jgi:ABC-type Fe3+/spermidine/putrescine transport system ATPase subunit